MRIVLTGAAGFVGSNLAYRLLGEGHEVIGVDNFITGQESNLKVLSEFENFSFIRHDVIKPLELDGDIDWVMHFASPASPPKYLAYPVETLRVNSEGTYHLLELAKAKNASFFMASTSEVYGDPEIHPQTEDYWGRVNPNGPRSVYDEAKRYAEAIVMAYHRNYNLSVRIIRIFNTYGPNMEIDDGRVVTNFIKQALSNIPLTIYGDGIQTRSFQYIDDLVEGIVRLMEVDYSSPVNLGNPEEYNMLELAEIVKDIIGSDSPIVFEPLPIDDPKKRKPDISVARNILGWSPKVEARKGIGETIDYFKQVLSD